MENDAYLKNLYQDLQDISSPEDEVYLEFEEIDLKLDASNDQTDDLMITHFESTESHEVLNLIELVQEEINESEDIIQSDIIEYCPDPPLLKRARTRAEPKKNMCYICDQEFETNRKKNIHITEVHGKLLSHVCPDCNYVSGNAKFIDSHIKKHREEATFICEYCSAAFIEMKALTRHTQVVHAENTEKTVACDKCGEYLRKHFSCNSSLIFGFYR